MPNPPLFNSDPFRRDKATEDVIEAWLLLRKVLSSLEKKKVIPFSQETGPLTPEDLFEAKRIIDNAKPYGYNEQH